LVIVWRGGAAVDVDGCSLLSRFRKREAVLALCWYLMSVVSELFATTGTMLVDLGSELDRILMARAYRRFDASVLGRIRPEVIQMVRGYQQRLGQGGEIDLTDAVSLLKPEYDLWVRREGRFRIRVRPDHVVGVGDLLVAQEQTPPTLWLQIDAASMASRGAA
jgi:hypothetical protein